MKLLFATLIVIIVIIGIDSKVISKRFSCPYGVRRFNCFVDPCLRQTCPSDPTARCIADYCGGCNAIWLSRFGKRVRCDEENEGHLRCPPGVREARCFRDPCQDETCPTDPTAQCFANYCGGCNFSWKDAYGQIIQC